MIKSTIKWIYFNILHPDILSLESIVTLISVVILLIILYYRYKYKYWSYYGVKFPPPQYLFGHGLALLSKSRLQYEVEWPQKYGKVYGLYLGTQPRLIVADTNVLRRICIKDFHQFPNHESVNAQSEIFHKFLFSMRDGYWKRVRSIITPTFTSGRMKRMFPLMLQCSLELNELFELCAKNNEELICKDVYGLYSMDVITTCCFGIKTCRSQKTDNIGQQTQTSKTNKKITNVNDAASRDSFVNAALKIVNPNIIGLIFNFLTPAFILKAFGAPGEANFQDMITRARAIIESRRHSNIKNDDYLQLLIDAEYNDQHDVELDTKESHHVGLFKSNQSIQDNQYQLSQKFKTATTIETSNKIKLNDTEVLANVLLFLFVGYESTATLMSHCLYNLAHHPEAQEKLFQELKTILNENNGQFTYESITSAKYLDAVICETLRLFPPIISIYRDVEQDYHLDEYNITIPKGAIIELSYYAIHHDPDYWPEPEKFDPTRFLPENAHKIIPSSYCPFGIGPRHCIANRFALAEAKIAISQNISQYQLSPGDGCKFPPSEPARTLFLIKFNNLKIKVKKRALS